MEIFSNTVNEQIYVYVDNFFMQWRIMPSLTAIENNFTYDGLCIYTKFELNNKFADLLNEERLNTNAKVTDLRSTQKNHISDNQLKEDLEFRKNQLLKQYKGILNSLADFTSLTESENMAIDQAFGSRSSFIKASRKFAND
ncbi:MAG: hypothetical protein WA071_00605 [Undibacterium umbellatum]